MNVISNVNDLLKSFTENTENPTTFLSIQPDVEAKFKDIVKQSYDITKILGSSFTKDNIALSKLIIDNFDVEQIWQQIELQNRSIYNDLNKKIRFYTSKLDTVSDKHKQVDQKKTVRFAEFSSKEQDNQTDAESDIGQNLIYLKHNSSDDKLTCKFDDLRTDKNENNEDKNKSSFEERQKRLHKCVQKLEEEALAEKPWQLKGEVTAKKRPQNSLLEQVLEFDLTTRPAPIITEEAALKLEDVIIKRIQNNAWDDVERKIKPIATATEFKKKLVLDQEKSKLSLAKIYEQDYLKQKEAINPEAKNKEEEVSKERRQLNILLDSLFRKLDALSNYHFTPIPTIPELKVVTNLPAVELEEAIPAAVSDAMLLAPEEIQRKNKGNLIGREERTSTDKNRARRQKQLKQKRKQKEIKKREKMLQSLKPGIDNKYLKQKIKNELENLSKNISISQFQEDLNGSKISKSSNFFGHLADTIIADKSKTKIKRKKENVITDAKRLKL